MVLLILYYDRPCIVLEKSLHSKMVLLIQQYNIRLDSVEVFTFQNGSINTLPPESTPYPFVYPLHSKMVLLIPVL